MLTVDVLREPLAGSGLHDVVLTIVSDDPDGFDHVLVTDRAMVPLAAGIDLGSCVKRFEYRFRGIAANRFPVSGVVRECANGATTSFGPLLGRETQADGAVRSPCRGTPGPTYSHMPAPIPPTPQCSAALAVLGELRTALFLACGELRAAESNRKLWAGILAALVVLAVLFWALFAAFPVLVGFAFAAVALSSLAVGAATSYNEAKQALFRAEDQITRLRSRYGSAAAAVRASCCSEDYGPGMLEPPSC